MLDSRIEESSFRSEFRILLEHLERSTKDKPIIIFTDIDGTILPTHIPGIDYKKYSKHLTNFFKYLREKHQAIIIPITGTSWIRETESSDVTPSVSKRLSDKVIPSIPQAIAAYGGKELYYKDRNGNYLKSMSYSKSIEESRLSFLNVVNYNIFDNFIEGFNAQNNNSKLYYQPKHIIDKENKKSIDEIGGVHLYLDTQDKSILANSLLARLADITQDIPNAEIVSCEERQHNDVSNSGLSKFCIDITPVNKASVINFVMGNIGQECSVFYFGDAGNDFPAACSKYVNFVGIPSGASPELVNRVSELEEMEKDVEYVPNEHDSPVITLHKLFFQFCKV